MKADRIAELKQLVPDDLVSQVAAAAEADPTFRAALYRNHSSHSGSPSSSALSLTLF